MVLQFDMKPEIRTAFKSVLRISLPFLHLHHCQPFAGVLQQWIQKYSGVKRNTNSVQPALVAIFLMSREYECFGAFS